MEEQINVPYIVFEGTQARNERTVRRLVTVIILLIAILFAETAIWLYAWNSYEYVDEGIEIDGGNGNASFIGRDLNGVYNYGEDQNLQTNPDEGER